MNTLIKVAFMSVMLSSPAFAAGDHQHNNQQSGMHQHMKDMQGVMENLKKESDPEKREALIVEHMDKMQTMMQMMKKEKDGNMSSMKLEERMKMMEERTGMMQMMMGQMLDQSAQSQKPKSGHQHKKK